MIDSPYLFSVISFEGDALKRLGRQRAFAEIQR
jgi:hypothetical protein